MKNIILTILTALTLTACGGGSGGNGSPAGGDTFPDVEQPDTEQPDDNVTEELFPHLTTEEYQSYDTKRINGKDAFDTYSGEGVKVGVIDAGYDLEHFELNETDVFLAYQNDIKELVGYTHGTSMLSMLSAKRNDKGIIGLIRNASFALANSNRNLGLIFEKFVEQDVTVVNNSYIVTPNRIPSIQVIKTLSEKAVFVFGAGNDGLDKNQTLYGEVDKNILIVGSLYNDFEGNHRRSNYSNYGYVVDVFVVADDLFLAKNKKVVPFRTGGTSTATTIVTSTIAIAQQSHPDINATTMADKICATAIHIGDEPYDLEDENGNMRSKIYGCGEVDVKAFFEALDAL